MDEKKVRNIIRNVLVESNLMSKGEIDSINKTMSEDLSSSDILMKVSTLYLTHESASDAFALKNHAKTHVQNGENQIPLANNEDPGLLSSDLYRVINSISCEGILTLTNSKELDSGKGTSPLLRMSRSVSSGTTVYNNIGSSILIDLPNQSRDSVTSSQIDFRLTNTTDGSESSDFSISTLVSGTLAERLTINSQGSVSISGGLTANGVITASGGNSTNWNAAHQWGNHASQGYLTGNQTISLSGDVTGSGTTSITTTVQDDSHNHSNYALNSVFGNYANKGWTMFDYCGHATNQMRFYYDDDTAELRVYQYDTSNDSYDDVALKLYNGSAYKTVLDTGNWTSTITLASLGYTGDNNANEYSLPIATSSALGGVRVGDNLSINASTGVLSADTVTLASLGYTGDTNANEYSLPIATSSALGGVRVGDNLSINASTGVLSADSVTLASLGYTGDTNANEYSLPIATSSALGGVRVGDNLSINASTGVLSADSVTLASLGYTGDTNANEYSLPIATSSALGGVRVGDNLSINASTGVLSADSVTLASLGYTGDTNANEYSLPIATSSALGGVRVGDNLSINASTGVLSADSVTLASLGYTGDTNANEYSLPIATSSALGGFKVGSNLSINASTGVLSATNDNTQYSGGDGLTGGTNGGTAINVGEGNGIEVAADSISVKADNGIQVGSGGVKVKSSNGISVIAAGVQVNPHHGITVDGNGVSVNVEANKGLSVGANGVAASVADPISFQSGSIGIADGAIAYGKLANIVGSSAGVLGYRGTGSGGAIAHGELLLSQHFTPAGTTTKSDAEQLTSGPSSTSTDDKTGLQTNQSSGLGSYDHCHSIPNHSHDFDHTHKMGINITVDAKGHVTAVALTDCHSETTEFELFNGNIKLARDLVVGDVLKSKSFSNEGIQTDLSKINGDFSNFDIFSKTYDISVEITSVKKTFANSIYHLNRKYELTDDHPVLATRDFSSLSNLVWEWIMVKHIKEGYYLFKEDFEHEEVFAIDYYEILTPIVRLGVEQEDVYFAQGLLHHNK